MSRERVFCIDVTESQCYILADKPRLTVDDCRAHPTELRALKNLQLLALVLVFVFHAKLLSFTTLNLACKKNSCDLYV